jgi:hypothetical protein
MQKIIGPVKLPVAFVFLVDLNERKGYTGFMKLSRAWLLRILIALGLVIIVYSILRHVTGFTVGEKNESFLMNAIVFAALGIFIYNRKLASDEKKEREEKTGAENGAGEGAEPPS